MPPFLKNFWQDDLKEIRENKIRFGAILVLLAVTVIFALADFTSTDTEIPIENAAPAPAAETEQIQPVQPAVPAASENIKVVLGANSSELYVSDPFTAPVVETYEPIPSTVQSFEPAEVELPEIPAEIPVAQIEPAEKFALDGTAISGDSKTAIIHKISGGEKTKNLIVSVGDNLDSRRVVDITPSFVALDDGSRIFFSP